MSLRRHRLVPSAAPKLRPMSAPDFFPCSPKTLAKLCVIGGGPQLSKAGRVPLYETADLDLWVQTKLSPKVSSSSELREGA